MNSHFAVRFALVALLSFACVAAARAANAGSVFPATVSFAGGGDGDGERLEAWIEQLGLTDEQRAAVEPIVRRRAAQSRAVLQAEGIERGKGPRASARQLRKAKRDLENIRKRTDAELAEILTDEQMDELKDARKAARKELRDRLKERRKEAE